MDGERTSRSRRAPVAGKVIARFAVLVAVHLTVLATGLATGPQSMAATIDPSPGTEAQPSPEEAAAQATARALHQAVQDRRDDVATAQESLHRAAQDASTALERYSQAVAAQRVAEADSERAQLELELAEQALARQRARLGRWARAAYVQGGSLESSPTLTVLLGSGDTEDLGGSAVWLTLVGDRRSRDLQQFASSAATQAQTARRVALGAAAADLAAAVARTARADRDAALEAQRQVVARLQAELAGSLDAAAEADRRVGLLEQARRFALGGNVVTGPVGSCVGGDTGRYGNGEIPLDALCPLWGTRGEYLRADAAHAFDRLSTAYAASFGRPLCVTDSYRSYPEQIRVYAQRPDLAAVPGTSNHGWGTAVDLCGGIESFGTASHAWMLLNAPGFGWFHPAWAQGDGSRPEPWHWEFGG